MSQGFSVIFSNKNVIFLFWPMTLFNYGNTPYNPTQIFNYHYPYSGK